MHELLILYILNKGQSTMYGLSKSISKFFGYVTNPSFGTIQPALKRLEKNGYVNTDKFFTEGGKPYYYYSITDSGKVFLLKKITSKLSKNPIQLSPEIKLRLTCSDILEEKERIELYKTVYSELVKLKTQTENIIASDIYRDNYAGRLVLDNALCEYNNMINLVKGLDKCLQ